jgi:hypothetical protein
MTGIILGSFSYDFGIILGSVSPRFTKFFRACRGRGQTAGPIPIAVIMVIRGLFLYSSLFRSNGNTKNSIALSICIL